ncbi:Sua5/YciO/YrdC/YwlC family protein [Candidatus Gracilibacteria bacterium]|nr:Sua5/YciO/YrdC/YwlC family protein [Candidatus Gracilibacteria bacterium]
MIQIIPTDTCYGLAGDVYSPEDYHEIYRLKGREFDKRLALLVSDWDMLCKYSEITDVQIDFLRNYPHPWSIILKRRDTFILPDFLDRTKYSNISFRVASVCLPPTLLEILPHFPLFLTSANLSGHSESTTFAGAISCFPGVEGYDGGVCDQPPSDIFSIGADGELQYVRRNYS